MPRHRPPPPSRLARIIDNIIRHKLKWIFGVVLGLGTSGTVAAYQIIEPWFYTSHALLRETVDEDHTYIVYLKLKDARLALKDAKDNLAKNPNDSTAQRAADYYDAVIKKYQKQLDKAAGN
jgi:hypothetical protein